MPTLEFNAIQHPGLILNPEELEAIRQKIDTQDWAKAALDDLIEKAGEYLSIVIPDRKGQWMHYYACPDDGTSLQTLSDTEHLCPTCKKVYTGEPYDSVVIRNRHMAITQGAIDLGLAYHLTGQQKYGDAAKNIVLAYADRYLTFPFVDKDGKPGDKGGAGRVFCTVLNESNWLTQISWAYDLIAADLTEAERNHACKDMLLPAGHIIRNNRPRIHNIHCWMNSAMGCAALCAGDGDLAHYAIQSEYGIINQFEKGILNDGFWYECSWGYHFYTMNAVWPLVEGLRHIGIDVYTDRYKSLFDAPLDFAFPGLYLPALNDSGQGRSLTNTESYEIAYARWGDPRHAGLLEKTDRTNRLALCFGKAELESEPPEKTVSVNFPDSGMAILRDGTSEDPTVVSLDYGPHGGGHGHPDKLGISLFGAGHELAPDPGSIQYSVPLHLEWFKTTLSHNTILVDQQPQAPCTGELHTFDIRDDIRIASASANDAYPGVQFKRTIALLNNGIVLDLVDLSSEDEHTYDWVFHCKGAFSSLLPFTPSKPLGTEHGYQHVANPQTTQTNDTWQAHWSLDDAHVTLVQTHSNNTEIFAGVGCGNPPSEKLPMVISRRRGKTTTYASAFIVQKDNTPNVNLSVGFTDATATFHLTIDGNQQSTDLQR